MKTNNKIKIIIAAVIAIIAILAFNTKVKADYEYTEEAYEQDGAEMVAEQNDYICESDYYVDGEKGVNTLFCMNINRISKVNYRISTQSNSTYINGHIVYTKGEVYDNNNLDGLAGYAAYQEYQLEQAVLKGRKYNECTDEEKALINHYKRILQKIFWSTKVEAKTVLKSKEDPLSETEGVLSFTDEASALGTDNYAAEDFTDLISTDDPDKQDEVNRNLRAYQYNLVYDTIIKYIKQTDEEANSHVYTNLFKNEKVLSSKDVQVLVNQTAGTYTVGPYKLNLVINDDVIDNKIIKFDKDGIKESVEEDSVTKEEILKYIKSDKSIDGEFRNIIGLSPLELLKKELAGENSGWTDENKFAWFDETNPVNFNIEGAKNIRVLDVNGNEITDLTTILTNKGGSGKEFFIEFEPEDYTKFINDFNIDLNFNVRIVNRHGLKKTIWKSEKKNEIHNSGTTEVEYKVGEALEAWGNWIKETKYTEKQSGEGTYETTASDGKTYVVYYRWQDDFVEAYKVCVKCKSYITSGGGYYTSGKEEFQGSVTIIGETEFEAEVWVEGNVILEWKEYKTPKKQGTNPETIKYVFEYARYETEKGEFHIKANAEFTVTLKIKWKYDWSRKFQDAVEISKPRRTIATAKNTIKLPCKGVSMNIGGKIWIDMDLQKKTKAGAFTSPDGKYQYGETLYEGMEVVLYKSKYDKSKGWVAFAREESTISGENGKYSFEQIDPLGRYYVEFKFNGEIYQQTYYKNSIPRGGGYSNAQEDSSQRNTLNSKLATINGDVNGDDAVTASGNYDGNKRAYGLNQKIMNSRGEYINVDVTNYNYYEYGLGSAINGEDGVLTFGDVYEKFRQIAFEKTKANNNGTVKFDENMNRTGIISYGSYTDTDKSTVFGEFRSWLSQIGISEAERNNICAYINDCLITAVTNKDRNSSKPVVYPTNTVFICEDYNERKPSEQTKIVDFSRNVYKEVNYLYSNKNCQKYDVSTTDANQKGGVDFGLNVRDLLDIEIDKDVQKITMTVNNQKIEYVQGKKDFMTNTAEFNVEYPKDKSLYTGATVYNRNIRTADYLFDAKDDQGADESKNLDVYITYAIMVNNVSNVYNTRINEVIDYYDNDSLEYIADNEIIKSNTYAVKPNGSVEGNSSDIENKKELIVSDTATNGNHTGFVKGDGYNYSNVKYLRTADDVAVLKPHEYFIYYITFKVKEENGKPKMDMETLNRTIIDTGKRNIAEINSYTSTYATGVQVPDKLDVNDGTINKTVEGEYAGKIDADSNPGSLRNIDLYQKSSLPADKVNDYVGRVITSYDSVLDNRKEDDTAEAPNVRLIFPVKDNRTIKGNVFEEIRKADVDGAKIGDGILNDGKSVNGITVQLVEVITDGENGKATGIAGERIVSYKKYSADGTKVEDDNTRYSTGHGEKVVKTFDEGQLAIIGNDNIGDGNYSFTNIPSGYYYIRFIYGDNDENVLTIGKNEVNSLINATNKGANETSYNGQDYKSTVYESGNATLQIGNTVINPYTDVENQNFGGSNKLVVYDSEAKGSEISSDKYGIAKSYANEASAMYSFDIANNKANGGKSDAKDIYSYRERGNNWANGEDGTGDLRNYRAEVLSSFEKKLTYNNPDTNAELQRSAIDELEYHTQMVAQTGVIDMTIEINKNNDNGDGEVSNSNHGEYKVVVLDDLTTIYDYEIGGVDFGLVERPRAQLMLNKEVANFKFVLQNGSTLVDTNKTQNDILSFADHAEHEAIVNDKLLSECRIKSGITNSLETVAMALDDELLAGANIEVTYNVKVTNVGEIDYTSKKFYYMGQKDGADTISKTRALRVADYPSNYLQFSEADQVQEGGQSIWTVTNKIDVDPTSPEVDDDADDNGTLVTIKLNDDIFKSLTNSDSVEDATKKVASGVVDHNDPSWAADYTNRQYVHELNTYTKVLATESLNKELLPEMANKDESSVNRNLILKTNVDTYADDSDNTYNNLAEIVATKNDQGRRMQFSVVGNQRLADQGAGDDAADTVKTSIDRIEPEEVDADSAQKIQLRAPTGKDKNYILAAATIIIAISLVAGSILIIKKKINK